MADVVATELLCSLCDEVCKKGSQMKCCGVRACKACAILQINKANKCWDNMCGMKDIIVDNDLKKDDLLREAVEYFKKNGNLNPEHKKMLKKDREAKMLAMKLKKEHNAYEKVEKKIKMAKIAKILEIKIKKDKEDRNVDVSEKFKQPCSFGNRCTRRTCLFVHDKSTVDDNNNKKAVDKETRIRKPWVEETPCRYGTRCRNKYCTFNHSPSRYGDRMRSDLKFDHSPSSKGGRMRDRDRSHSSKRGRLREDHKFDHSPSSRGDRMRDRERSHSSKRGRMREDHSPSSRGDRMRDDLKFDHSLSSKGGRMRDLRGDLRSVIRYSGSSIRRSPYRMGRRDIH